jgi:uncharacterized protein
MVFSKHNIVAGIADSGGYYIVNLLSGNADILSAAEYGKIADASALEDPEFISKGYVVDPLEEEKAYHDAYVRFMAERNQEEVQIFFALTYQCNFNCFYCFQGEYVSPGKPLQEKVLVAFFDYLDKAFTGRRKYLTLFGGEPLLRGEKHKHLVARFIELANARNLGISVVTNGYYLEEYLPVLRQGRIREIQVTLDGVAGVHNKRRPLQTGGPTFDKIVRGIDLALGADLPVNLRVVVDRENLPHLMELARFAGSRGWTQHPHFKTQLGRNYELHSCQRKKDILLTRAELYREIYNLIQSHPEILEFHRPAFSFARFLSENGSLPDPVFDTCPGTKYEWAFDYTGKIYACTATVGKAGEDLGTFYPGVVLKQEKIACWQSRDVTRIAGCKDCRLQLACGGGCAALAANKEGELHEADCRPVPELVGMGLKLYADHKQEVCQCTIK